MFSLKRRWIWANQTGLSKARGHKKGQKRFWPGAAGQNWQKLAEDGWLAAAGLSPSYLGAREGQEPLGSDLEGC